MIALFKQKSPANIVVLLILGLIIKMPLFLFPKAIEAGTGDGHLYYFIISLITTPGHSNAFTASILCFSLLYGQALMINFLVNEQRMTTKQTFLPAMSYLLITSLFPEWNYLSAPLTASLFIVWAFIKLFKLYNISAASGVIFNIGLLLGISSLIYFPSIAYLLCIFLGLMILRPFRFNEAMLVILGIIAPYYFYAVYLFLNDNLQVNQLLPKFAFKIQPLTTSIWPAIAVALMGIPFLIGGYYIQTQLRKVLIQVRKNWSILLLYLVLSLVIPLTSGTGSFQNWVIAATPFAAFHACAYLYPQKAAFPVILFFITLLFVFFQQYGVPAWRL